LWPSCPSWWEDRVSHGHCWILSIADSRNQAITHRNR